MGLFEIITAYGQRRDLVNKLFGGPVNETGPVKPRPPTPGLHLPASGFHIPDYRSYKLENAPELVETQRRLHARGLHSPWLR